MEQLEYLAYLATNVPPGNLARAAARKLARRATRTFGGRAPPDDRAILAAFCADDSRDLALKLAAPRASQLWADASRRESVRASAAAVPGLVERVAERAERAWRREFDVFGTRVAFGRTPAGIDWHRDALNAGRFSPVRGAFDEGLWQRGLDPKAPWSLARFEQALALGQGVWLARSEEALARYSREFTAQVSHFVRENPPGHGVNWSSPMEVALRAANLSLAFLMMRHRPELQDGQFALDYARLQILHGRFVEAHLEHTGAVPNNHYVANLVGLLHLGVVFPELPEARGWRERALEGLRGEIRRQVLDDGFSFEGSTAYHRLATELFTLALLAAGEGRVDLGEEYRDRLHLMYRAVRGYLTPRGLAPQLGDNDSGRALPLADRGPLEHGYLLPLGAALFEDPELKPEGSAYGDEALFVLGPAGLERFEALPESGPTGTGSLPRAGLFFLRSAQAYCAISCGPNGQAGLGGHSHNDKLAIEIHGGAGPLVVDTGTGCYVSDPETRNHFRSTAAHSTLQLDGLEQNRIPSTRLFALPDEARARRLVFESSPMRERFVGEHRGYARHWPARHQREVVLDRGARGFAVIDRVLGPGAHEAVVRFHLPDRQARLRPSTDAERERLARLPAAVGLETQEVFELGAPGAPGALLAGPAGIPGRLAEAWYSPGYGQRRRSVCVEFAVAGELPLEVVVGILLL